MPTRRAPLRLGLVGLGRATEGLHLPALRHVTDWEVVAGADADSRRLDAIGTRFRIPRCHSDYRALLNDADVDAIAVCVPPSLHLEVAVAALAAGKHVFIEKPLAVSLADCDRIVDGATRSRGKAMVGFNLRWHRLIRQARERIQGGELGEVTLIRSMFTTGERLRVAETPREHVGVLVDLGVHHFDLWRYLTGSEVEDVYATLRPGPGDGESAIVTARMQNGTAASSVFSDQTTENNELEIYGRKGSIRVSCYRFDGLESMAALDLPGSLRNLPSRMAATLKEIPHAVQSAKRGGDFSSSYQGEWCAFADAIRNDAEVECTVDDGRHAVQVAQAAAISVLESRSVRMADVRSGSLR